VAERREAKNGLQEIPGVRSLLRYYRLLRRIRYIAARGPRRAIQTSFTF